ncbi:MAG: sorbosone dehydrogenase family protein [Myxococcota bacterium]
MGAPAIRFLLLVWVLALVSCGSCHQRGPAGPPLAEERAPSAPVPGTEVPEPAPLPGEVRTQVQDVAEVCVRLDDLPAPFASESARKSPNLVDPPADATLRVPRAEGGRFRVQLFADEVPFARWLARTPDGRVLVAQSKAERISWLRDADGDGVADSRGRLGDGAQGLDIPFGMAFAPDGRALYVGNQNAVRRYAWRRGQERLEGPGEVVAELPGGGYRQHWTRNVLLDGERMFVSVGSRSNVAVEAAPRATIQVADFDPSVPGGRVGPLRTFAAGLRNPVGLALREGALWATVNERDHLGDDLVPDYLARIEEGAFYGWPYAYLAPNLLDPRRLAGGRSEDPARAAATRSPEVLFQAHSAALGLGFVPEDAPLPARYRGGAIVAHRGSWNRSAGTGYRLVFVPFEGGAATGCYEPFVEGFLVDPSGPDTWGRPVGVLVQPDGSVLFTEESGGRVYRVSFAAR